MYRLYWYDGMGGLKKIAKGRKSHKQETLELAREKAKKVLSKIREQGISHYSNRKQIVIVRYEDKWKSKIVEVINHE